MHTKHKPKFIHLDNAEEEIKKMLTDNRIWQERTWNLSIHLPRELRSPISQKRVSGFRQPQKKLQADRSSGLAV